MLKVVSNAANAVESTPELRERPGQAVEDAIEAIAADARKSPMAYAKETVMPEGGE